MDLEKIFPPSNLESNTKNKDDKSAQTHSFPHASRILNTSINRVHFERKNARNVGFRGIRPFVYNYMEEGVAQAIQGWSCRVLHSPLIYAIIALEGTLFNPEYYNEEYAKETQWTSFSILGFPPKDSALLERYPLHAVSIASQDNYEDSIRNWNFNMEECLPFTLATMHIGVLPEQEKSCGACSINLVLEAKSRLQTISLDGVKYDEENYLIPPQSVEADIPAYYYTKYIFETLARTLGFTLGDYMEEGVQKTFPQRYIHKRDASTLCYTEKGEVGYKEASTHMITYAICFGKNLLNKEYFNKGKDFSLVVKKEFVEDMPLIHVVSGFLGSGKTTFLREWLAYLQNKDIYMGVIQNEFGKIGLDSTLLAADTIVEALDEGCVCCSLADALRPGIKRILERMPRQDIILETSGVANPNNVANALNDLDDTAKKGLIISVSDAKLLEEALVENAGEYTLNLQGIAISQVECVDILVINKVDLIQEETLEKLRIAIKKHNKNAIIVESSFGRIPFAMLDEMWDAIIEKRNKDKLTKADLLKPMNLMNRATHTDDPDGAYVSKIISIPHKMPREKIIKLIKDSGVVRAKGIVDIEEEGRCIVQYASNITSFTVCHEEDSKEFDLYLVFIGKNINTNVLASFEEEINNRGR